MEAIVFCLISFLVIVCYPENMHTKFDICVLFHSGDKLFCIGIPFFILKIEFSVMTNRIILSYCQTVVIFML